MTTVWLPLMSLGLLAITAAAADEVCCGKNEGPNKCYNECYARTCANRRKQDRVCIKVCRKNPCDCASGFLRNDCGECVREHQCDEPCDMKPIQCQGQNECLVPCFDPTKARICKNSRPSREASCPADSPFPLELDAKFDYTEANPIPWDPKMRGMCILNVCDCMAGYSRNKCGACVKDYKCDKPCRAKRCDPCSDPNEIRYKRLRACDVRTCAGLNHKQRRRRPCKPGQPGTGTPPIKCKDNDKMYRNQCDCKPDYYRDDCGRCVPEKDCYKQRPCQCTNPCKKKNEEWRCVNTCTVRTCDNFYNPKQCFADNCTYQCDCKEGLYRNRNRKCVPKGQCSQEDLDVTSQMVMASDVMTASDVSTE